MADAMPLAKEICSFEKCLSGRRPMVRLNLIIAQSRVHGAEFGLKALENVSDDDRKRLRPLWDCAIADAFERLSRPEDAMAHLTDALALSSNKAQRRLIEQKLARLQANL